MLAVTVITLSAVCVDFRKGSVIVDFSVWVDAVLDDNVVLRDVMKNLGSLTIGGQAVDLHSFTLSGEFAIIGYKLLSFQL